MIVVRHIMTVTMHCPIQGLFETVRVAMGFYHFPVFVDGLKNSRGMGVGRHH